MHDQTLAPSTKQLLRKLAALPLPPYFYLSGGTALALHLGHRESEDLDFFSQTDFNPSQLQTKLESLGNLTKLELDPNTLNCELGGVKLQLLGYPYPLLKPTLSWQGIQLSSTLDIALTKLQTVSMRGSKKDFIDMYFILQQYALPQLFDALPRKYPKTSHNIPHFLKSLIYFADAEEQPMPRMHSKIKWSAIKDSLLQTVKSFRV